MLERSTFSFALGVAVVAIGIGVSAWFFWSPSDVQNALSLSQPNEACMFSENERIAPNTSAEAEELFQRGRAHDLSIVADLPETIPLYLRGTTPNRAEARRLYQEAADMGHVGAMNNLAVYEQNGWGHPDPNSFPRNHPKSLQLNIEMARRGDVRGYVGMGLSYATGRAGITDHQRAQNCFIEAAKRDDARGILLLARHDLLLIRLDNVETPPKPQRVPRGLALLEELGRRGNHEGFEDLADYYQFKEKDPLKQEYYLREAAKISPLFFWSNLSPLYKFEGTPLYNPEMVACLQNLTPEDMPHVDTLCPRPDGPATREAAGLPQAPTTPYDLSALQFIED
ncbi:MAG: hypothetical protein AAGL89_16480 [Pseudomonadota bacterium]